MTNADALSDEMRKRSRSTYIWTFSTSLSVSLFWQAVSKFGKFQNDVGGFDLAQVPGNDAAAYGSTLFAVLFTTGFAARSFVLQGRLRRRRDQLQAEEAKRRQGESISDRIAVLTGNLSDSRRMIDELSAEVRVRGEMLERLAAEAEEKRNLAALHADEAAAVDSLINRRFEEHAARQESSSRRQQWGFLVLGSVLLAVPVGVVGNFVFEWLK